LLDVRQHLLDEHRLRYRQMVTTGGGLGSTQALAVYLVRNHEKAPRRR
jgi:hypothetical protein